MMGDTYMKEEIEESKNHRLLEKSLEILEYISLNPNGKNLTEVCRYVDMPKSTVYSLLRTFSNLNFMQKDDATGQYLLGLKAFEIGAQYTESKAYLRQGRSIVEKVSLACDETCHLVILDGIDVVYIYKYESSQAIRMISTIGKRTPAHATAVGKALLSGYSDDQIRSLYKNKQLNKLTENTITDIEVLIDQIHTIQVTGISFEKEESTPNVQCVAVPIQNKDGLVVTAISVSIPVFRVNDNMERYVEALLVGKHEFEMTLVQ